MANTKLTLERYFKNLKSNKKNTSKKNVNPVKKPSPSTFAGYIVENGIDREDSELRRYSRDAFNERVGETITRNLTKGVKKKK